MTNTIISSASMVYVRTKVTATKSGAAYDPTGDVVEFAFVAPGGDESHEDVVWTAGDWETVDGEHYARILVGGVEADPPGENLPLAPGAYDVYVRVTDDPEIPVLGPETLVVR